MKIPLIDLAGQHKALRGPMRAAVQKVFDSRQFVLKSQVAALEAAISRHCGVSHGVGLASGSDALYLALEALGIGPGDEVITTPFTFFATAGSISRTGATPVFADVDLTTFNLDVSEVEKKITPRTKAVIPVHLFGLCCDMGALLALCRRASVAVVEDAAQAIGAQYRGRQAGSMGDAGCFSFYPTKNLGAAGDGGMLVTDSARLAEKIKLLRDHGSREKYRHELIGINSRLDEIQAAVLLVKWKHLARWNQARRRHAAQYTKLLKGLPLRTPIEPDGYHHVYHLYSIATEKRDALATYLTDKGVGCGVYYPVPLHLQECYRSLGYRPGDLPVSELLSKKILSLPMYPELTETQIRTVARHIRAFFEHK